MSIMDPVELHWNGRGLRLVPGSFAGDSIEISVEPVVEGEEDTRMTVWSYEGSTGFNVSVLLWEGVQDYVRNMEETFPRTQR